MRFDEAELEQRTYVYWRLLHVSGTAEGTRDRVSPGSLGGRERGAGEYGSTGVREYGSTGVQE